MGTTYTLRARVYVNADKSKVVPEDSPEAAYVLGGEGSEIPMEDAQRLGLTDEGPSDEGAAEQNAEEEEEDDLGGTSDDANADTEAEAEAAPTKRGPGRPKKEG